MSDTRAPRRVVIAGAGGRDFHNFNCVFRDNPDFDVRAFTATQIPGIDDRRYPAELAGSLYPGGIPIEPEQDLLKIIADESVDEVVFAYSDVSFDHVMTLGSRVIAAGADYRLIGANATMLRSKVPIIAVGAVRTGSGKSQTTRRIADLLRAAGKHVVAIRHPMPYGDLRRQVVQRFATLADLDLHECTIEEREEYEPHIQRGCVVYAGVDYGKILAQAEQEADVILWDGGNNDLPFYRPDLEIVVADPLRIGHERRYHPGAANVYRAQVVIINKVDSARPEDVKALRASIAEMNPSATIIEAASPMTVDEPERVRGARVLCVEDGPTVTHGDMAYGVAAITAKKLGARELVDPRPFAKGDLARVFAKYPHLREVLPAVGYGDEQVADLAATIEASDADLVLIGTPIDLRRVIDFSKPALRVQYELQEIGQPDLRSVLTERGFL
ncbi:MAG: GTPase [Deltaproteobacteria bacterium]|nr:GTPase [Deltaproteobacteria bacterium]